jgi:hypothetical protein
MEGISTDLVKQLMAKKVSKPAKWAMLRNESGLEIVAVNKSTTVRVGSFQGNVGSIARSRRGRTYRKPNGERYYLQGSEDIVAYKV